MKKSITAYEIINYKLSQFENRELHTPYAYEQLMMNYVKDGDLKGLTEFFSQIDFNNTNHGILSYSEKKQKEYSAVIGISLMARAAIAGGVDEYRIYDLNDLYLQKIADTTDENEYLKISEHAITQFIKETQNIKQHKENLLHIKKAKQYISSNLNKELTLTNIAEYVGVSPTYLSRLFSQAEKETLKTYILKERIHASTNFLKYSPYSIFEIAHYLGFSSQSHFDRTFKKFIGETPSQFRKHAKCDNFFVS